MGKSIDWGKSFTFIFDDPDWVMKILLGALAVFASSFLIGIPFLYGYSIKIFENIKNKKERILPAWDNLGEIFNLGIKGFLAYMGYMLAITVLWIALFVVSLVVGGLLGKASGALAAIFGLFMGVVWLVFIVFACALSLGVFPFVFGKIVDGASISECYAVGELITFVKGNIANLGMLFLLGIAFGFISGLGGIAFGIGAFFTSAYSYFCLAYLAAMVWYNRDGFEGIPETISAPEPAPETE